MELSYKKYQKLLSKGNALQRSAIGHMAYIPLLDVLLPGIIQDIRKAEKKQNLSRTSKKKTSENSEVFSMSNQIIF